MAEPALPVVGLTVVHTDGSAGTPTPRQQQLLEATQRLLRADPHFQALHSPLLSRAEVDGGLAETQPGYLYLRYDTPGAAPQEFWAHVGSQSRVAWKGGQVSVTLG